MHKKVCEVCGFKFLTSRDDTVYCSDACKQKAYWQRKTPDRG